MKNKDDYLLSIVIPTRNRQFYALEAVKQCLAVTDDRVQVVVSDNSDSDSLQHQIESLQEQRIKYRFIAHRIPGVDNYANGIEMSDGEYVCCLGDDDGVVTYITDVVSWAKDHHVTAIKPGVQATYIWPNVVSYYKDGCVGLSEYSARYWYVNVKEELVKFLNTGCGDLPNAMLPKAYHGIIRRDLFDKINEKTGHYCGGLSPDIYLSISLSLLIDKLLCIDVPLTIFGACKQSTTGDSLNKTNKGKLEDAPHFIGQPYEWSKKVPRFYCGSNIWADSAMHALEEMDAKDMMGEFSVERLTCDGWLNQKLYREELMENFRNNNGDSVLLKELIKKERTRAFIRQAKSCLRNNKIVFGTYRKLRDLSKRSSGSKAFPVTSISGIAEAEQLISKAVSKEVSSLLSALRESEEK